MNDKLIIGVVGSGAMGSGIAQVAASAGHTVCLFDQNAEALNKSKLTIVSNLQKAVEKQKLSEQQAEEIKAGINLANTLDSFSKCGLVIEAIVENLDVKQKLFSDLEKVVSKECMLASNTSSLSIASIASVTANPERVLGVHFFNPAHIMPLVEIIPGIATSSPILKSCTNFISSWGKTTVLAKDTPGFIVNRVARPYYGEAIRIFEEGIADMTTIDWAMKEVGKFKMGPFELMDFIGNDINYKVTETVWEQFFYDSRYKPSLTQKRLFEAKRFGRKSGRGYYDYAVGAVIPEPNRNIEQAENIFMRIFSMLVNEAVDAVYLNIANKQDVDLAMTKGVNYPKGLLKWSDEIGLEKILIVLQNLQELYGEERYRPSVLMKKMAQTGEKFFT